MGHCSMGIIPIILGAVLILGLAKRAFFRRRFGYGGGCGHRGYHHGYGGHGPFGGHGPGRSWWLRGLFSRLDTTPGQEKEIRAAIEEVQRVAREAKEGVFGSRESVAKAFAADVFDGSAIDEASAKIDASTARVKEAIRSALERVHSVLDPKQRERLAELLQRGPRGFRGGWGGPYREA